MAVGPPPRSLTPEQVQARWDAGARTLFEIDPELGRWHRRNRQMFACQIAAIALSLVMAVGILIMCLVSGRA